MRGSIDVFFRLVLLVGGALLLGVGTASAQTGPGGVGDSTGTTGSESLTLWLRSDVGVQTVTGSESKTGKEEVDLWEDQSGNGHDLNEVSENDKRQPVYESGVLNGNPIIKFNTASQDNTDALDNTDSEVKNIPTGSNTFFLVSAVREEPTDNFWQFIHFNQNENIGYNTLSKVVSDRNGPTLTASPTITDYNVLSSVFDDPGAEEDLGVNGTIDASASGVSTVSSANLEIAKNGKIVKGNVVEVVAYKSALNTAERRLVANYLAEKYDLALDGNDYYRFGSGHPSEIVGIGQAAADGASDAGAHTEATSSVLTIRENGSNSLSDGEFVMMGHDGTGASSFTTSERLNGSSNAQKIEREWRAEVTGTGTKTVDVEVDYSSLSLPAGYNDRALFVDDDGDFTSGATYHDLDNKSGDIYEASGVDISDGDYVAVAAIKRVVDFATTGANKREDAGTDLTVDVSLNFPTDAGDSDVTVNFNDTGDLDGSTYIEDGGATNSSGTNGNGDYEADDGSGNDTDGAFDGDYRLKNTSKTISAGNTSATLSIKIDDDNISSSSPYEQTEKFEVTLGSINNAAKGSDGRFVGSIIDDENPNKIAYSSSSDNDGRDKDPNDNYGEELNKTNQTEADKTLVFEVALPDGKSGNSSPATKATYEVTGGTATADDDFKIISGTENGSRVSATEGEVTIPDGDQYGRFELEINEDNTYEGKETVTLALTGAQGGTIDGDDKTSHTLTTSHDDSKPTLDFSSDLFTKRENLDAGFNVELSEAAGTDIDVTFEDEGTGSASDGGTDYTFPASPTITIPAGNTSGTFTISVNDDTEEEQNETIDVRIKSATAATLGTKKTSIHEIVDNDRIGSVGPGGVGGEKTLAFWGKADGLDKSDGDSVSPWPDSSGNGNDATNPSDITCDEPTFVASGPNGQPTLNFDKAGDPDCFDLDVSALESLPNDDYTLFALSKAGSDASKQSLLDIQTSGCNSDVLKFRYKNSRKDVSIANDDGDGSLQKESTSTPTGSALTNFHLLSAKSQANTLDISSDGQERSSNEYSLLGGTGDDVFTGVTCGTQEKMNGQIAELIFYDISLNAAQRNIVRNYLSAKYDVGLDANDLYAGDENGNGDYDFSVLGVGKDGGASLDFAHSQAENGGITLDVATVSDGDYVLVGTTAENPYGAAEQLNYEGTSGVTDLAVRPDSIWFASITGSPSFDVTFDLTTLGFESRSRQDDGYVLLGASAGSCTPDSDNCSWSDAGGSVAVTGDEVIFSDVSLSAGDYYLAIGTTAPTESPLLNSYARPVGGQAGTDGSDEGWRYVGVPVTGAIIDDVQPPLSNDRDGLVGFGERGVWHWSLNNGNSKNNDGWTQLESGHQVPNGRGFIVHLADDSEYPIDPTLWMDVEPNSLPPGDADVTVGNSTPSADTKLRTDTTWHLLANPYAVDYDLSNLNLGDDGDDGGGGKSDFKSGVQLWDPYAGSYTTIMQGGDNTDHLAPWEAFFAERNDFDGGANTQLTFGKSGRQPSDGEDFIGSKSRAEPDYRHLDLRLVVQDGEGMEIARDEAARLYFHSEAGPGEDAYDLSKLMPGSQDYAALGVMADDRAGEQRLWAVHSRARTPTDTVTVPLDLQTDLSGTFTISAPDWTNVPDDWTVTLVDTKGTSDPSDDETHQLGRDGASPYAFSLSESKRAAPTGQATEDASASGEAAPSLPPVRTLRPSRRAEAKSAGVPDTRFRLRVAPGSETLPVEMASMNATVDEQSVRLAWTTASEQNNAGFYVEHQRLPTDDTTAAPKPRAWTEASFVEGAGTTEEAQEYSTQIRDLDYGRHVFRLRQVEAGGTVTYTDAVEAAVRLDGSHAVGAPYPNPARQRATVEVTVREEQPVRAELYDVLGRRVRTVHDDTVPAQETRRLRMSTDQLASGAYFLRVQGDDFVETRRVTVVR